MKKNHLLLIIVLVCFSTISVKAGNYSNGDLTAIINGASAGEIINLTGTTYSFSAAPTLDKSLTIQADAGLSARPVITCGFSAAAYLFTATGTSDQYLTLKGLEFNGGTMATGLTQGSATVKFTVTVDNCKTSNFYTGSGGKMFNYVASSAWTTNGDLTVSNSEFVGAKPNSILLTATTIPSPNNITFSNCYFTGFNTANATITVATSTNLAGITIDHCTFQNCTSGAKQVLALPTTASPAPLIKNCIFVDIAGTSNNTTTTNAANAQNVVYNSGDATSAKWSKLGSITYPILTTNPALGSNGITTEATYINTGTDGKTIGYYGSQSVTTDLPIKTELKSVIITQRGTSFHVDGVADTDFSVYSITGNLILSGCLSEGKFHLAATKGVYILKTGVKATKFIIE